MTGRDVRELLLTRAGRVYLDSRGHPGDEALVRAVELELAALGYVVSSPLRARLHGASRDELVSFRSFAIDALRAHAGGGPEHEPLFRSFPDDIPSDTAALWWKRVLVHFLQAPDQPCLHCAMRGTTHVLSPCSHVVCDRCFDGRVYGGCPVCGNAVDRESPFFRESPLAGESPTRELPRETIRFRMLELGVDPEHDARELFERLCARTQALSPDDRDALRLLARLAWAPRAIPVRENVAYVLGALFARERAEDVLPVARRFMTSATDVLRFLAVISGADASLQPQRAVIHATAEQLRTRLRGASATRIPRSELSVLVVKKRRFAMAKLSRPLRRALLSLLDGLDRAQLIEDMLRHRSLWVWAGQFLHPAEQAKRFPRAAEAFAIVRGEGTFETWSAKVESAMTARDPERLLPVLEERPGELARRLDHALRTVGDVALDAFVRHVESVSTPVLLTLRNHLPLRAERATTRVYWPKGAVAKGVFGPDDRATLSAETIAASLAAIEQELLRRFARQPRFDDAILDEALRRVLVPFNERTASPSAIALPRGSRIPVPAGAIARLFLHWCEPPQGRRTDLDLSIAFYDERWRFAGMCSYSQLTFSAPSGARIATSSGDFTSAPHPEGATEFVDLDRSAALAAGHRYAVMVVNAFSGLSFSALERGFAGLMLRDDPHGAHFDPRTVALRFALTGGSGVYLPLVLDLEDDALHWLDVQSTGALRFNNVATSNAAITTIAPTLIDYFGRGSRTSMFELSALHAAARCRRVIVRGASPRTFVRCDDEPARDFLTRILEGREGEPRQAQLERPALAALLRGDLALPEGSVAYALFREGLTGTIAASDLLA